MQAPTWSTQFSFEQVPRARVQPRLKRRACMTQGMQAPTWLTSLSRRLAPSQVGSTSISCLHLRQATNQSTKQSITAVDHQRQHIHQLLAPAAAPAQPGVQPTNLRRKQHREASSSMRNSDAARSGATRARRALGVGGDEPSWRSPRGAHLCFISPSIRLPTRRGTSRLRAVTGSDRAGAAWL